MADVQDLIDYYANLLIIQYHNKPKAKATIELLAGEVLADGILFDIRDGYAVDSAVGTQLDVIGKYVGVDRFYINHDPINYFGLTNYTEVDPDSEEKWGFTTYADYNDNQYNGTLNYNSILSITNSLNDDDYRVIIRLKILQNNINHSHKEINDSVYAIFGRDIRPDSTGDMHMVYFITDNLTAIINAALLKNLLPRPMGVGLTLITNVAKPFFGFTSYAYLGTLDDAWSDDTLITWGDGTGASTFAPAFNLSSNIRGFTTYADYDTNGGSILIYDQIS